MDYDYGACATESTHKVISTQENAMKLTINNPAGRTVTKVKVDGCLSTITGKRCDYLFEIDRPIMHVIYLELKGHDIAKAYGQLKATVQHFKSIHKHCPKKECYIVASRIPKAGPQIQQLKIQSLKDNNATLFVETRQASIAL